MLKKFTGFKTCFILLYYFCAKNICFGKYLAIYARNARREKYEGLQVKYLFLGAFVKSLKGPISFVISVRLYVCTSAAPPRRISVKFDIGAFNENLSRQYKLG